MCSVNNSTPNSVYHYVTVGWGKRQNSKKDIFNVKNSSPQFLCILSQSVRISNNFIVILSTSIIDTFYHRLDHCQSNIIITVISSHFAETFTSKIGLSRLLEAFFAFLESKDPRLDVPYTIIKWTHGLMLFEDPYEHRITVIIKLSWHAS